MGMKYDFSGWATRNDLRCSDGRVIRAGAFKGNDGMKVPLIWNHDHTTPEMVIGHAMLENRDDGVFAYCSLNDSEKGKATKEAVKHGDVVSLSIYANQLKQAGSDVIHGMIREVSVVLAGANPGAMIENVYLAHSDQILDDEAYIYTDMPLTLEHSMKDEDEEDEKLEKEDTKKKTSDEDLDEEDDEDEEEDEDKKQIFTCMSLFSFLLKGFSLETPSLNSLNTSFQTFTTFFTLFYFSSQK